MPSGMSSSFEQLFLKYAHAHLILHSFKERLIVSLAHLVLHNKNIIINLSKVMRETKKFEKTIIFCAISLLELTRQRSKWLSLRKLLTWAWCDVLGREGNNFKAWVVKPTYKILACYLD